MNARYDDGGSVTATINGVTWHGITPESRFWADVEAWVAEGNTIAPYVAPVVVPPPARYSKKRLFEAMTEAEYDTFEQTEAQQPAKDRRVFREAQELDAADPGFARFEGLLVQVYGAERAAEMLADAEL